MEINGARIVWECLRRQGVKDVFGYPGGQVIPIYNELYDFRDINHILVRHEQGAAHAADGYARVTGKAGVCIATSGPGATNLVTGIMTAHMDSVPMVIITGQVPLSLIGNDAFQETDITGITLPITKHSYLVQSIEELVKFMKEAFYIAETGRPGPVLIDIPKNIQVESIKMSDFEKLYERKVEIRSYSPNYIGNIRQIKLAVEYINKSEKPLVVLGAGIIKSKADTELKEFLEYTKIPATSTLLGLGALSSEYENYLGMAGMHGTVASNYAIYDSDLLIAVGMRFDDRITGKLETFAPNAKVIHIDIDPAEIGKNRRAEVPIVGDLKNVIGEINKKITDFNKDNIKNWIETVIKWKKEYPIIYKKDPNIIKPQEVIEKINEITKGEAIIVTDVGQHQMWAAQFYDFKKPGHLCSSGGAGTMGYGLPAAMGAKVAKKKEIVVAIVGDGGIQMNSQELITLAQYDIAVKIVILNNSYLGMVRQWQEIFYERRYSAVDLNINPDFVLLAKANKIKGVEISLPSELDKILRENLESDEPVLFDIKVSKEENVLPMVPSGGEGNKMIGITGEI